MDFKIHSHGDQALAASHAKRVTEYAAKYLSTHDEDAAEALEDLYGKTEAYYRERYSDYAGVLASHAHILALWNINEHFRPDAARAYAHTAERCYREYMDSESARGNLNLKQTLKAYFENARLICGYLDYNDDDLQGAMRWVQDIAATGNATVIALGATILLRQAVEEGRDSFMPAFKMFQQMDEMFTEPTRQLFEEDIIRAAYGFYELCYTHGVYDPAHPVPFDPGRAVRILTRARDLLRSPEQRAWMQEDIDEAKSKMV